MENTDEKANTGNEDDPMQVDPIDTPQDEDEGGQGRETLKRPRDDDDDDDDDDMRALLAKRAKTQAATDMVNPVITTQVATALASNIMANGTAKEATLAMQLDTVLNTTKKKKPALSAEQARDEKTARAKKQNLVIIHIAASLLMPFRLLRLLKRLYISHLTGLASKSAKPRDEVLHFIVDGLVQLRTLDGGSAISIVDSQWKQAYVFVNKSAVIHRELLSFVEKKSNQDNIALVIPPDTEANDDTWDQDFTLQRTSRLVLAFLASYETGRLLSNDDTNPYYDVDEGSLADLNVGSITNEQAATLRKLYLTMLRGHFLFRDNDSLLRVSQERVRYLVSETSKAYGVVQTIVEHVTPAILLNLVAELVAEIVSINARPSDFIKNELSAIAPHLPVDFGRFFLRLHGQTSPVFKNRELFDLMKWRDSGDANALASFDAYKLLYEQSKNVRALIEAHAKVHLRDKFKLKAFQVNEIIDMYNQEASVNPKEQQGRRGLLFNIPPGSGKTLLVLFGAHFCNAVIQHDRRATLFIVPSSAMASFEDTIRDMFNPGFLAYRYKEGEFINIRKASEVVVANGAGNDTRDMGRMDTFFHRAKPETPDFVIISHEKFVTLDPNDNSQSNTARTEDYRSIVQPAWRRVIVDESHLLHNILHIRSLMLERLIRSATYLMTGTLIMRKPEDAIAQLRILGYRSLTDPGLPTDDSSIREQCEAWDSAAKPEDIKSFFKNRKLGERVAEPEKSLLKLTPSFFKAQTLFSHRPTLAMKAGIHRYVSLTPTFNGQDVNFNNFTMDQVRQFGNDDMDVSQDSPYEKLKSHVDAIQQSALETKIQKLWAYIFKDSYTDVLLKLKEEPLKNSIKSSHVVTKKKDDNDIKKEEAIQAAILKSDPTLYKEFKKEQAEAEKEAARGANEEDMDVSTIYLDADLRKKLYVINQFMSLPFDIHTMSATALERLKAYVLRGIKVIEFDIRNQQQQAPTSTGIMATGFSLARSLWGKIVSTPTVQGGISSEAQLLQDMNDFLAELNAIKKYNKKVLKTHPMTTDASADFASTQLILADVKDPPSARIRQLLTLVEGFLALDKRNKLLLFFNRPVHMYLFGHWLLVKNDKARLMLESSEPPEAIPDDAFYYTYYDQKHEVSKIRRNIQRQFNTNDAVRVCLMTYAVGSTGLNLQGANGIVFTQPPETYAEYRQAYSRAYREGIRSPNVYLFNFALKDSPEMVRNSVRKYYEKLEARLDEVYGRLEWDAPPKENVAKK